MRAHAIYDEIGISYAAGRRPDPRWASAIEAALGGAWSVLNVGAGTGSYESAGRHVLAVEPSLVMIAQRPAGAAPVVRGVAERLPCRSDAADAVMALLTVHHWADWRAGLAELRRTAARRVVLSYDAAAVSSGFWLLRDYIPEVGELESGRVPPPEAIAEELGGATIRPLLVPWDCQDGVLPAYWRRPAAYLDPAIRRNCSGLAQVSQDAVARGTARLARDLRDGTWASRNAELLGLDEFDGGFRIIVSQS